MCINLETSILAYVVGTITGWTLYKKGDKENQVIGIVIIFVTLIQLIEALMYIYGNKYYKYLSIILAICLGLQGFVYSQAYKNIFGTPEITYYVAAIISIIITAMAVSPSFYTGKLNNKITWEFMGNNHPIDYIYWAMYVTIALSMLANKKFITFGSLMGLSYGYSYWFSPTINKPSMWCMTSAIVTPLYLLLELNTKAIVL
jgi:hypothetical protein